MLVSAVIISGQGCLQYKDISIAQNNLEKRYRIIKSEEDKFKFCVFLIQSGLVYPNGNIKRLKAIFSDDLIDVAQNENGRLSVVMLINGDNTPKRRRLTFNTNPWRLYLYSRINGDIEWFSLTTADSSASRILEALKNKKTATTGLWEAPQAIWLWDGSRIDVLSDKHHDELDGKNVEIYGTLKRWQTKTESSSVSSPLIKINSITNKMFQCGPYPSFQIYYFDTDTVVRSIVDMR